MSSWRNAVSDPKEVGLFEALEHPKYLWRTMSALQRESGLDEEDIRRVLQKYRFLVRKGRSQSGEPIWALQERYWKRPGLEQIMSFLSRTSSSSRSSE